MCSFFKSFMIVFTSDEEEDCLEHEGYVEEWESSSIDYITEEEDD